MDAAIFAGKRKARGTHPPPASTGYHRLAVLSQQHQLVLNLPTRCGWLFHDFEVFLPTVVTIFLKLSFYLHQLVLFWSTKVLFSVVMVFLSSEMIQDSVTVLLVFI